MSLVDNLHQWMVFADGLVLVFDLHQWMVFADGLVLVDDLHLWMVLVDGPILLVVVVPLVCYKLVEPSQKHHTKFEGKLQYYMFSEKRNIILSFNHYYS